MNLLLKLIAMPFYDFFLYLFDVSEDDLNFSDLRLNWTLSLKTEKKFIHSKPLQ